MCRRHFCKSSTLFLASGEDKGFIWGICFLKLMFNWQHSWGDGIAGPLVPSGSQRHTSLVWQRVAVANKIPVFWGLQQWSLPPVVVRSLPNWKRVSFAAMPSPSPHQNKPCECPESSAVALSLSAISSTAPHVSNSYWVRGFPHS